MMTFLIQTILDKVITTNRYFVSYTTRHFDILRYSDKPDYSHLQCLNTYDSVSNNSIQSMYPKNRVSYSLRQNDFKNSSFGSNSNSIQNEYSAYENDIETLLTDTNNNSIQEPSYDDLNDFMVFLNNIDLSVSNIYPISINEINSTDRRNMNSINDKIEKYVDKFYKKIMRHIKDSVAKTYHSKYLNRILKISKSIKSVGNRSLNDTRIVFTSDIDAKYLNILRKLQLNYENRLILDNKIYKSFSHDLDSELLELQVSVFCNHDLIRQLIHKDPYLILNEFMNFYKYLTEIPELLTLGYVAIQHHISKTVVIFHLINLFIKQNNGRLIEKKVFLIFLIP